MPTQVQFRRGSTAQNNSFTGAAGELSVNTSNNSVRVHDGSTAGGTELATLAYASNASNLSTGTLGAARLIVTIGAGSTGSGSNSSVTSVEGVWSNVVCDGGGAGGRNQAFYGGPNYAGQPGGSGGGGGAEQGSGGNNFGLGYPGLGNNGGGGYGNAAGRGGGGGGGAGSAGTNGYTYPGAWVGGDAGSAYTSSISGTPASYAGGGQGVGTNINGASAAPGGLVNSPAPANGGGGAGGNSTGGPGSADYSGGSGIVILRSIARAATTVGSPTQSQVGNEWIYTFTGSGEVVIGTV